MDLKLAKKVCALVAGIIEADGEFHPDESALLRRVMSRLGLSVHADAPLSPPGGERAAEQMSALPERERLEAFEMLIEAALVDGKVVPEERRYLEAAASALVVDMQQLEQFLAQRLNEGRAT